LEQGAECVIVQMYEFFCFPVMQQAKSGLGLLIIKFYRTYTIRQTNTHTHTITFGVGLLWASDQPVADAATYTTHKKHKGQTTMPSAEFEFPFPEITQLLIYALDRTVTGMG